MPRKKSKREPTPKQEGEQILVDATKAGTDYAQDQIGGDYFQDWVLEQMAEGEAMRQADPNSVIPLETPSDAKKLARNMLQQLEWDTKRDMKARDILELSGAKGVFDVGSADWVRDHYGITYEEVNDAFFSAFDEALKSPSVRQWVTDLILENLDEVRGTPKSKLGEARRPPRPAKAEWMRTFQDEAVAFGAHPGQIKWQDAEYMYRQGWTAKAAARDVYGPKLGEAHRGRRPVVRDYIAVDPKGRTVAGPFTDYSEAKREADRARGYVRFASRTHERSRRPTRPHRRPR